MPTRDISGDDRLDRSEILVASASLRGPRYLQRMVSAELARCRSFDRISDTLHFANEYWVILLLVAKANLAQCLCMVQDLGKSRALPVELVSRYLSLLEGDRLLCSFRRDDTAAVGYALTARGWEKLSAQLLPLPAND